MARLTKVQKEQATKFVGDHPEILRALQSTWQAIGGDVLDVAVGDGTSGSGTYNSRRGGTIPRSEVIEVVLDAGHLETYGVDRGFRRNTQEAAYSKFMIEEFRKLSYDQKKFIAEMEFKYSRYGY